MKKKILSVLLAATLVVSLFAGCGKSKKDNIIKMRPYKFKKNR